MSRLIVAGLGENLNAAIHIIESGRCDADYVVIRPRAAEFSSGKRCVGTIRRYSLFDIDEIVRAGRYSEIYFLGDHGEMGLTQVLRTSFAERYMTRAGGGSTMMPNVFYRALKLLCDDLRLRIGHPIELFPRWSMQVGETIGVASKRDFEVIGLARKYLEKQPWESVKQAVIVCAETEEVLMDEKKDGTDAMLERFQALGTPSISTRAILVKVGLAPHLGIHAPTIGSHTLTKCQKFGVSGIAVDAKNALVLNKGQFQPLVGGKLEFVIAG
jgi:hypothetical protein